MRRTYQFEELFDRISRVCKDVWLPSGCSLSVEWIENTEKKQTFTQENLITSLYLQRDRHPPVHIVEKRIKSYYDAAIRQIFGAEIDYLREASRLSDLGIAPYFNCVDDLRRLRLLMFDNCINWKAFYGKFTDQARTIDLVGQHINIEVFTMLDKPPVVELGNWIVITANGELDRQP